MPAARIDLRAENGRDKLMMGYSCDRQVIISRVVFHQYSIGVHGFMTKSLSDYFLNTQFKSTDSHKYTEKNGAGT